MRHFIIGIVLGASICMHIMLHEMRQERHKSNLEYIDMADKFVHMGRNAETFCRGEKELLRSDMDCDFEIAEVEKAVAAMKATNESNR